MKKGNRLSPNLEKCCLLLVGNESFANAERDLKMLTGINVPHSTQHRLLERYKLPEPETTEKVEALSIDGGNIINTVVLLCKGWRIIPLCPVF